MTLISLDKIERRVGDTIVLDGATRSARRGLRVGYAAQIPALIEGHAVEESVLRGDGKFDELCNRIAELSAALESSPGDERTLSAYGENGLSFTSCRRSEAVDSARGRDGPAETTP